jgi:hypothetical protein
MTNIKLLISKLRLWELKSKSALLCGYMHERKSGAENKGKDVYGNLYADSVIYREEVESMLKFKDDLKVKLEGLLTGELEDTYEDIYGPGSVTEDILNQFTEDYFSPIKHNSGLINYIESRYKIDSVLSAGFRKFFPDAMKVLMPNGEFRPVTQQDELSQESIRDIEMIEDLNALEHFRFTMQMAYEILIEGGTPLEILTLLKEEGLLESN